MGNELLEIGPLEMKVIGALNASGEQSVSQIQSKLKSDGHDLAYTTVMTVLVRLFKKGHLTRAKIGRQFFYSTARKKDSSPLNIFAKVKKSLFGSERLKPILSLLEADDGLSRDELEALKLAVEARLKKRGRS